MHTCTHTCIHTHTHTQTQTHTRTTTNTHTHTHTHTHTQVPQTSSMQGNMIGMQSLKWEYHNVQLTVKPFAHNCVSSTTGALSVMDTFGENRLPFVLGGVNCSGSEQGLLDCPRIQSNSVSCSAYQDAGVVCQGEMLANQVVAHILMHVYGNSARHFM